MKHLIQYTFAVLTLFTLIQCTSEPSGLVIEGKVSNLKGNDMFFERSPFNAAFESLTKTETDADGNFEIQLSENPGAGVYRLRSEGRNSLLILDGSEGRISLNTDAQLFSRNTYDIDGCPGCTEYNQAMTAQYNNKMDFTTMSTFFKDVKNPYAAQGYAGTFLKSRPDFVNFHQGIYDRLKAEYPDHNHDSYLTYINQMNQQAAARRSAEKIKVGQEAPDIELPDANGKIRKLSDLKGKVVLIDFWASWCGPCRRANPEVVKLYDKYNSDGFDVFSVSLDGVDEQSKRRAKMDDATYKKRIADSKNRWLGAIEKDDLKWNSHVSELTKWDSKYAKEYGVSGIPKTFLIDRDGKIAAVNPRLNLEEELNKIL